MSSGASRTAARDDARLAERYKKMGELTVKRDLFAKGMIQEPGPPGCCSLTAPTRIYDRDTMRLSKVARSPAVLARGQG